MLLFLKENKQKDFFFSASVSAATLRLDADIIDWFKTKTLNGEGYQTSNNNALRAFVEQQTGR